jgi:hypothetical protein
MKMGTIRSPCLYDSAARRNAAIDADAFGRRAGEIIAKAVAASDDGPSESEKRRRSK